MAERTGRVDRRTAETHVTVNIALDGGPAEIHTGVGFLDHMLEHFARHGRLGLQLSATGDQHVDDHHTVEDVGIGLGQALEDALGDKTGIERFGFASIPMDEALARVSVDLSGRPALGFDPPFHAERIGAFQTQLVEEFLRAVTTHGRFACHVEVPRGSNDHHMAEAIFKALGRSVREAVRRGDDAIPSTKGVL